jgi:hypothetical protein
MITLDAEWCGSLNPVFPEQHAAAWAIGRAAARQDSRAAVSRAPPAPAAWRHLSWRRAGQKCMRPQPVVRLIFWWFGVVELKERWRVNFHKTF